MRFLLQERAARVASFGPPVTFPRAATPFALTLLLAFAMLLTAQETQGQSLFKAVCAACHSTIPDSIIVGPSLAGIAARAVDRIPGLDPRAFIVEGFPPNQMSKGLGERYSQEEIDAVIAYLMTLP